MLSISLFLYFYNIIILTTVESSTDRTIYVEYAPFPDIPDAVCKPKDERFWQKYDHFNGDNKDMWEQRYWNISTFHKRGGPVFLWLNGASPLSKEWTYNGQLMKYARKHNAYCFILEHRFYGKSHPRSILSMKGMETLHSKQALADAAYFIESMKKQHPSLEKVKWIVFGGSYGGSLAAWLRLKYPSLVHGAVASGAALVATDGYTKYYRLINDTFLSYQANCIHEITKAYEHLNDLIKTEEGRIQIKDTFNLCTNLEDTTMAKKFFFYVLAENIAAVIEHSKDFKESNERNRLSEYHDSSDYSISAKLKYLTIKDVCYVMTHKKCYWENKIKSTITRYADVHKLILEKSHKICLDVNYTTFLHRMRETNVWLAPNDLKWLYQRCNEFGYFQTPDQKGKLFNQHMDKEFYIKMCSDVFLSGFDKIRIEKGILETNRFYGERNTAYDDNILLVYGSLDPWKYLGIYEGIRYPQNKVLIIKDAGHCADLYLESFFDKNELKRARKAISRVLESWLKQNYN